MRNPPAPADQRADEHRDPDGQTNQVPDPEKSKRQKEIISRHCSAPTKPKSLRHIGGQYLRLNDDREYRGNDRAPQYRKQTGPPMFTVGSMLGIAAAPDLKHFSPCNTSRIRQTGSCNSARRRGIEYITPRIPPSAQIQNEIQNGNSVHQPIMIRPGNTKMIDESVPAAEATVWTMLFS